MRTRSVSMDSTGGVAVAADGRLTLSLRSTAAPPCSRSATASEESSNAARWSGVEPSNGHSPTATSSVYEKKKSGRNRADRG